MTDPGDIEPDISRWQRVLELIPTYTNVWSERAVFAQAERQTERTRAGSSVNWYVSTRPGMRHADLENLNALRAEDAPRAAIV